MGLKSFLTRCGHFIGRYRRRTMGFSWWIFPIVMAIIGQLVLALRAPVSWPPQENIYPWLTVSVIIGAAWVISGLIYVYDQETTTPELQKDTFFSTAVTLVVTAYCSYQIGSGSIAWTYIVPWIMAVVDLFTTGYGSINNAAQKPLMREQ